jgi:hypothetical protein
MGQKKGEINRLNLPPSTLFMCGYCFLAGTIRCQKLHIIKTDTAVISLHLNLKLCLAFEWSLLPVTTFAAAFSKSGCATTFAITPLLWKQRL